MTTSWTGMVIFWETLPRATTEMLALTSLPHREQETKSCDVK
jgi:hypothetical protein